MPAPIRIELPGYAFEMIPIQGGTFRMGSPKGVKGTLDSEYPAHDVTVRDFCLGRYPVTQALWRAVALAAPEFGLNPEPFNFKGEEHPVENVSWNDIKEKFLPALEKLTGRSFRLPTEAEWEYAARGGKYNAEGFAYAGSDKLREVGWHEKNSSYETQVVGLLYPNALGLYDMSGNVWEWCEDDWCDHCERVAVDTNDWKELPDRDVYRVMRGGSGWDLLGICHVAFCGHGELASRIANIGFRLASQF